MVEPQPVNPAPLAPAKRTPSEESHEAFIRGEKDTPDCAECPPGCAGCKTAKKQKYQMGVYSTIQRNNNTGEALKDIRQTADGIMMFDHAKNVSTNLIPVRLVWKNAYRVDDSGRAEKFFYRVDIYACEEGGNKLQTEFLGELDELAEELVNQDLNQMAVYSVKNALSVRAMKLRTEKLEELKIGRAVGVYIDKEDALYFADGVKIPVRPATDEARKHETKIIERLKTPKDKTVPQALDALATLGDLYFNAFIPNIVIGWVLQAPLSYVSRRTNNFAPYLWFQGKNSMGKSTLTMALCSLFGNGFDDELSGDAVAKEYRVIETLSGGLPRTVSEGGAALQHSGVLELLKHSATSTQSSKRGNANRKAMDEYESSASLVFTSNASEHSPFDAGSGWKSRVMRAYIPETEDWSSDHSKRAVFNACVSNLNMNTAFGKMWIERLVARWPRASMFANDVNVLAEKIEKHLSGNVVRQAKGFASIQLALTELAGLYKEHKMVVPHWLMFTEEVYPHERVGKMASAAIGESTTDLLGRSLAQWSQGRISTLEFEESNRVLLVNDRTTERARSERLNEYLSGELGIYKTTVEGVEVVDFTKAGLDRFKEQKRIPIDLTLDMAASELNTAFMRAEINDRAENKPHLLAWQGKNKTVRSVRVKWASIERVMAVGGQTTIQDTE